MQNRLAFIRSRAIALRAVSPVSTEETFHPIPAARFSATCGGVVFRKENPVEIPENETEIFPDREIPDYEPISPRLSDRLSPALERWAANIEATFGPIADLP